MYNVSRRLIMTEYENFAPNPTTPIPVTGKIKGRPSVRATVENLERPGLERAIFKKE
jgi:hypothetical protein